jgi:hypothetical protein
VAIRVRRATRTWEEAISPDTTVAAPIPHGNIGTLA